MQIGEFLDTYKPNEKHRIRLIEANEYNFLIPDDGKIYFVSGTDFTSGSYLYDITKLKGQLANIGKELNAVGIWGKPEDKIYYCDSSNSLDINDLMVINELFIRNKGIRLIDKSTNPDDIPDILQNEKERILDYFKNDCGITVSVSRRFNRYGVGLILDENTAVEGYEAVEGKEYEIYYTQYDHNGYEIFLDGKKWYIANRDGFDYEDIHFDVLD